MRTRILPSMTNFEVEQYLQRNDIILVPLGVNEMHGGMPLDIEYVIADGNARVIAEQIDALVLPNLVYFSAGGTTIGRGTVYMSMQDSYLYTMAIARSLLSQGFRRILFVPAHGDTRVFMNAVISDFFDETKCPILSFDVGSVLRRFGVSIPMMDLHHADPVTRGDKLGCSTVACGYYRICGRLGDVPTGAEVNGQPGTLQDAYLGHEDPYPFAPIPGFDALHELLGAFMPIPIYFDQPSNHGSQPLPETREDVEREGAIGEAFIRSQLAKIDWSRYTDGLRKADRHFQEVALPRYGTHLPKARPVPTFRP